MGIFKKRFKKKEKNKHEFSEKIAKQKQIKNQLDAIFKDKRNKVCKLCEDSIAESERYTKQGGYFWHNKCWNKAKAMAKKNHM